MLARGLLFRRRRIYSAVGVVVGVVVKVAVGFCGFPWAVRSAGVVEYLMMAEYGLS